MLFSILLTISPCRRRRRWQMALWHNNRTWPDQSLGYLGFHLHGEVLEHVVEVFDAPLQLQDLVVPRLDLVKSLSRRLGVV